MKILWGMVVGLGMALLVAGAPARAHGQSTDQSQSQMGQSQAGQSQAGQAQPGASAEQQSAMGQKNQLTGKVQKFDRVKNELTLENKKLKVSEDTQVLKDGQTASLQDIKEGDQVRASYSGSGTALQANKIEVMTSGSTAPRGGAGGMSAPSGTQTPGQTTPGQAPSGSQQQPSGGRGY